MEKKNTIILSIQSSLTHTRTYFQSISNRRQAPVCFFLLIVLFLLHHTISDLHRRKQNEETEEKNICFVFLIPPEAHSDREGSFYANNSRNQSVWCFPLTPNDLEKKWNLLGVIRQDSEVRNSTRWTNLTERVKITTLAFLTALFDGVPAEQEARWYLTKHAVLADAAMICRIALMISDGGFVSQFLIKKIQQQNNQSSLKPRV